MSINVFEETVISLREARKLLPKSPRNKSISIPTFYRWIQKGIKAKDGTQVKLEIVKIGGSTFTSQQAIQRFVDQLSACSNDCDSQSSMTSSGRGLGERPRTTLQQRRHDEWVKERLDELLGVRKCGVCKRELKILNQGIPKTEKLYCPQCVVKIPAVTFGQRLRIFRWNANTSQGELASTTEIPITEIRAIERGTKVPTEVQLQRLIAVLGNELVAGMSATDRSA